MWLDKWLSEAIPRRPGLPSPPVRSCYGLDGDCPRQLHIGTGNLHATNSTKWEALRPLGFTNSRWRNCHCRMYLYSTSIYISDPIIVDCSLFTCLPGSYGMCAYMCQGLDIKDHVCTQGQTHHGGVVVCTCCTHECSVCRQKTSFILSVYYVSLLFDIVPKQI